jgi:hypothetical protein
MVTAKREAPGADTIKEVDSVLEGLSHHGSAYSAFDLLVFTLVGTARHTSVRRHRLELWQDTVLFKADSHIACRSHAAPMSFPCHAVPLRV